MEKFLLKNRLAWVIIGFVSDRDHSQRKVQMLFIQGSPYHDPAYLSRLFFPDHLQAMGS